MTTAEADPTAAISRSGRILDHDTRERLIFLAPAGI